MSTLKNPKFKKFLENVAKTSYKQNTTATGTTTIQQTKRNELRKKGLEALYDDLENLYGEWFDIVETKEGIVIVVENEVDDFTFSWEIKSTIKSLDYDPFIEATRWEDEKQTKEEKKNRIALEKIAKQEALEKKRQKKLAELSGARCVIEANEVSGN